MNIKMDPQKQIIEYQQPIRNYHIVNRKKYCVDILRLVIVVYIIHKRHYYLIIKEVILVSKNINDKSCIILTTPNILY